MAIIPWQCALGEAPPAVLRLGKSQTYALAPPDNSIDTNRVTITGTGVIGSLGPAPGLQLIDPSTDPPRRALVGVTKRVTFDPLGGNIVLLHSAKLQLLGGVNRTIRHKAVGVYCCDPVGVWTEEGFTDATFAGVALVFEATRGADGSPAADVWTNYGFDNVAVDRQLGYDVSRGVWTCQFAGVYQVHAFVNVNSHEGNGGLMIDAPDTLAQTAGPGFSAITLGCVCRLDVGDIVQVRARSGSGTFGAGGQFRIWRLG